jgi:hypothetical protein
VHLQHHRQIIGRRQPGAPRKSRKHGGTGEHRRETPAAQLPLAQMCTPATLDLALDPGLTPVFHRRSQSGVAQQ